MCRIVKINVHLYERFAPGLMYLQLVKILNIYNIIIIIRII
jgi:hypothetical protein